MATGRMQFLSDSMKRITDFSFVLPNDKKAEECAGNPHYDRPVKTLYLLHGYSGTDTDWLWGGGNAHHIADIYNLNVIMPTTGNNWYLDRPGRGNQYGRYVGQELIDYTRKLFGLSDRREDTLIGGFSMGGYGAIHTGFAYPETFGSVIALSSGLVMYRFEDMKPGYEEGDFDYNYFAEVFGDPGRVHETDAHLETLIKRRLVSKTISANQKYAARNSGKMDPNKENVTPDPGKDNLEKDNLDNDRIRQNAQCDNRKKTKGLIPKLYMACGTEDALIDYNRRFASFLEREGVDFRYEEGPGDHQWSFWNDYIMRGLDWIL